MGRLNARLKRFEKILGKRNETDQYDQPDISIRADYIDKYLHDNLESISPEQDAIFKKEFSKKLKPLPEKNEGMIEELLIKYNLSPPTKEE